MKLKHTLLPLLFSSVPVQAASLVTGGHIDFPAFGYVSNAEVTADPTLTQGFEPHIHNEGGADGAIIDGVRVEDDTEFEPDELIVVGRKSSTITVGSTTYFWLPETEAQAAAQGVPFVGIGLEELAVSDWVGGTVTLSLQSFSGPGEFLLWQDDGFGGENIFLDTANNIISFTLTAGSHTHYNWGFTNEGLFDLGFGISGTHVDDGFQSGSATYTIAIPEPSAALLGTLGVLGLLRRRR
ncbi:MAG: choice-of-anchor M domain-containing protein [Akkermansiaceae bacterium]|jgi:surface-anchored protein|nr:choice-of-anchor M domain-containing protein [Akkermansiaceae bacterium]